MKNISILPVEYRQEQKRQERLSVYVLAAALVLAAYIIGLTGLYIKNQEMEAEARNIRAQNSGLESQILLLEPYKSALSKMQDIDALAGKAAGTNPDWSILLSELFSEKPDNLWLTEITCNYRGDAGELVMRGSALKETAVAQWMAGLKNLHELTNIDCKVSLETGSGDVQSIQFEIWAGILKGSQRHFDLEGSPQP